METIAKILNDGEHQIVEMPKGFEVECSEMKISRIGDVLMLEPKEETQSAFEKACRMFSEDFMEDGRGREEPDDEIEF